MSDPPPDPLTRPNASDIAFLAGEGAVLWAALGETVTDLSADLDPTALYMALADILERMEAPVLTAALVYGVVATFGQVEPS